MPVYIGSLGRMVKLPYVTSQSVEAEERYSFTRTLEGKRKAQPKPVGRRAWTLATQHFRPEEHSLLSQFANGAWGPGPFVFVSADAPHTNLLTPTAADSTETNIAYSLFEQGGPWQVAPGVWSPGSYVSADPANFMPLGDRFYPCIPGQEITGSAYLQGEGSKIGLFFWDANDTVISGTYSAEAGSGASPKRLSISMTVPANAVRCGLTASGAVRGAMPAITWTGSVQPWSDGQGCLKAVVSSFGRDQVLAVPGHTFSNISFTVTEVG